MAKGGFTGAVPPRETSPEEYSGVWDITEQYGEQKAGSWPFQADDCAPKSLRFNASDSAYLSKTYAAAGNRKTWTWSGWVKRGSLSTNNPVVFSADTGNAPWTAWQFTQSDGTIQITTFAGVSPGLLTNASFRDPSAWYHIVIAMDTTQATASDRVKLYVNGEQQTFSNTNYPAQNSDTKVNGAFNHYIGYTTNQFFDGELSEVHLIDGQALSCDEFGFFDGQGIWQPKRFTGDYSSGPVYSNQTTINDAGGSTLSPGNIFDGDTSTFIRPISNDTIYEGANADDYIFRLGNLSFSGASELKLKLRGNSEGYNYIWFNDDINTKQSVSIGNSSAAVVTVTSLPSTITAISLAGPDTGTGNFGLSIYYLEIDGVILTDASVGRNSFHLDFSDGVKDQSGLGNDWTPVGTIPYNPSTTTYSSALTTTLGVSSPVTNAFDGLDSTSANVNNSTANGDVLRWTFSPSSPITVNSSIAFKIGPYAPGGGQTAYGQIGTDTFTYNVTSSPTVQTFPFTGTISSSTPLKIYSNRQGYSGGYSTAFYSLYVDGVPLIDAGVATDLFVDSPVNGNEASTGAGGQRRGNYATLNPLAFSSLPLVDGNLQTSGGGTTWLSAFSTIKTPESGKWFYECTPLGGNNGIIGIFKDLPQTNTYIGDQKESYGWYGAPGVTSEGPNNTQVSYNSGATFTTNDVIGVALDLDAGTLTFYKNGTSQGVAFSGLSGSFYFAVSRYNGDMKVNFGQRPFEHPVSGFSPLATSFLTEPTIKRGDEAMDVKLWSGDGAFSRQIKTRLSPDLVWLKVRNASNTWHHITDIVRGAPNKLYPNDTSIEDTAPIYGQVDSLDSDGFTVGDGTHGTNPLSDVNQVGQTYVGWIWDAGDATATIAAGSLNSSVYNTSQVWTNYSGDQTTKSPSNVFDGDSSTNFGFPTSAGNGNSGTFTFSITGASTIRIRAYTGYATTSNGGFQVNSVDIQSQITTTPQWITISGSSLSSIYMAKGNSGGSNFDPVLEAVEVDGKILVDSTATPSNVPSIATTVRARPETGFSILNYSASGTAGASVAHQLGKAPEFMICKNRDYAQNWFMFHKTVGAGGGFNFNVSTAAYTTDTGYWNGDEPDNYKITLGNYHGAFGTHDYVLYAWTSVEGYSSFGTYEGSNTSLPYIYTGFSPRWILIANMDNVNDYVIYDTARDDNNQSSTVLAANSSNSESTYISGYELDILSNGFKIRTPNSGAINQNAHTHVYAAFASHPFASNARAR